MESVLCKITNLLLCDTVQENNTNCNLIEIWHGVGVGRYPWVCTHTRGFGSMQYVDPTRLGVKWQESQWSWGGKVAGNLWVYAGLHHVQEPCGVHMLLHWDSVCRYGRGWRKFVTLCNLYYWIIYWNRVILLFSCVQVEGLLGRQWCRKWCHAYTGCGKIK